MKFKAFLKEPTPLFQTLKCSIYFQQNATSRGRLTAKTAVNNRGDLAQITKFNGKSELPWWTGKCNKIE